MNGIPNGNRIDTTLGDLIAAISDVAFEYSNDYKEAYELTRLVLVEILREVFVRDKFVVQQCPASKYLN